MKILYLYAELMGYQIPILKEYVDSYDAEVHVVHWDHKKLTPYNPPKIKGVEYYKRSEYKLSDLKKIALELNPDIVYVSGWMDRDYLSVCKTLRNKGVTVVAGCDTQWKGNLRQILGAVYFKLYIKKSISHVWVAGIYQFEYARKLGFKKKEIIYNTLSADYNLFNVDEKKEIHNSFLYVGNFRKIKGTDILIEAFEIYQKELKGDWGLICIGNGELSYLFKDRNNITVYDFKSQKELVDLSKNAGVFILPSRFDQWGLVVHEFATLGFPLLLSENVGAASTFLINGYNGFSFKSADKNALANIMYSISNMSNSELSRMGENSKLLSQRITPQISAASFMSALNN